MKLYIKVQFGRKIRPKFAAFIESPCTYFKIEPNIPCCYEFS